MLRILLYSPRQRTAGLGANSAHNILSLSYRNTSPMVPMVDRMPSKAKRLNLLSLQNMVFGDLTEVTRTTIMLHVEQQQVLFKSSKMLSSKVERFSIPKLPFIMLKNHCLIHLHASSGSSEAFQGKGAKSREIGKSTSCIT